MRNKSLAYHSNDVSVYNTKHGNNYNFNVLQQEMVKPFQYKRKISQDVNSL